MRWGSHRVCERLALGRNSIYLRHENPRFELCFLAGNSRERLAIPLSSDRSKQRLEQLTIPIKPILSWGGTESGGSLGQRWPSYRRILILMVGSAFCYCWAPAISGRRRFRGGGEIVSSKLWRSGSYDSRAPYVSRPWGVKQICVSMQFECYAVRK